jgi:hypothetical protein
MEVALQFHGNIPAAKDFGEPLYATASFLHAAVGQGHRQRTFLAAGEADESSGVFLQFVGESSPFAFFRAKFHFRDQAAEVLIAEAGSHQQREPERIVIPSRARTPCSPYFLRGRGKAFATDLRPDMRLETYFLGCHIEARRTKDTIPVEQRHGRHIQVSASRHQSLGQGSAFEETKSGTGVKLDVQGGTWHGVSSWLKP